MATQENIMQYLPQHLQAVALNYMIPDDMLQTNPDLVVLVLESKSINEQKEKQSWFDLYPLMNQDQIDKLRDILTREKQKLAEIEARYQAKQEEIKKKYEQTYAS
jgi:membrane-bound lytic murein transglycosylase B